MPMGNRRFFLKQLGKGLGSVSLGLGLIPDPILTSGDQFKFTILHTNDMHSRIDPFPLDGGRNQGLGGVARRASMIAKIRAETEHVLLLDSGDIFQGTPFFNFFGGELEFKIMSEMAYDAATIGNHDFDGGIEGLVRHWDHAKFPFVSSNYDFSNTALANKIEQNLVFEVGSLRIGVFGLGIELDGRVPKHLYQETRYLDPIERANAAALQLKKEMKCEYVICLSHLGYRYRQDRIDDRKLAASTQNINIILGGHTHTFLVHPEVIPDLDGQPVMINQAGWAGLQLGRIDVVIEHSRKGQCSTCENLWIT